jgi:hypothetical protein
VARAGSRRKLVQSLSGMIRDPANRVRQPRARIDVVEYRGRDQQIHRVPLFRLCRKLIGLDGSTGYSTFGQRFGGERQQPLS